MTSTKGIAFVMLAGCMAVSGCAWTARGLSAPEKPTPDELLATYRNTTLNQATAGDVLTMVRNPELQLVMQSPNVVAISGPKDQPGTSWQTNRIWMTIVTFGESLTASNKYFYLVNDKPQAFMHDKYIRARFDVERTVTKEVLTKNYPDEEAKNIAILRDVLAGFNESAKEVKFMDTRVRSCAMSVDQVMNAIVVKLKASPIEASRLADPGGLPFEDLNMGKGHIRMVVSGDVAKVILIIGSVSEDMASIPDVQRM